MNYCTSISADVGQSGGSEFESLVPSDKHLDPAWIKSLTERGEPQIYRGGELKFIGMPVGGFFAGQLYLGGDGQLWHWDIFNENRFTRSEHYASPLLPDAELKCGFSLQIGDLTIPLDSNGFSDVTFRGEYPIGTVKYVDLSVPLQITLDAFSPFIPLDTENSSFPATILRFTVRNASDKMVRAMLTGRLENFIADLQKNDLCGFRINRVMEIGGNNFLECSAEESQDVAGQTAPDRIIEDWNMKDYKGWSVEGDAFGKAPLARADIPDEFGDIGGNDEYLVNSNASAPGTDYLERAAANGKLTSAPFILDRKYLYFWIAGGNKVGRTCLNLIVDGNVVKTATGRNDHTMRLEKFRLDQYQGKLGIIEIVDREADRWGEIAVGRIVLSDRNPNPEAFANSEGNGSLVLALLGGIADKSSESKTVPIADRLVGSLGRILTLQPGEETTVCFVLCWYFPNLSHIPCVANQGRWYGARFHSAIEVAEHIAANEQKLMGETMLWKKTWYDSTLPYWFLDRTFINTSILATSTCYRFKDERFWAWEGVGSCPGTCGHVWYYGHSIARLYPEIERDQREKVDFNISQDPDGWIRFRGENDANTAIDSQAGYILRSLREHQMTSDNAFLMRVWPSVKLAMNCMISKDIGGEGIIRGNQHNTLDSDWYGEIAWLSGVYQAALLAAAEMADLMEEGDYAGKCRKFAEAGRNYMARNLFNGEYYQNKIDPAHLDSVNSGSGCEIDQVLGQSWAFQVGLRRVFPKDETLKSLQAIWRYNFCSDVGPYREINKPGRWYAMPGEAGLLMCTFPKRDWDYERAKGAGKDVRWASYLNECMNGFEHQVASHMIWEGTPESELVTKGLAIERAIHDRYSASKRNPYNEIECGDHYARSMASYGVFLAACGYRYDGPKGRIAFAPKVSPENFKAAFTTAEGWGSYSQKIGSDCMIGELCVKWGSLRLRQIDLQPKAGMKSSCARVTVGESELIARFTVSEQSVEVFFLDEIRLTPGNDLRICLNSL